MITPIRLTPDRRLHTHTDDFVEPEHVEHDDTEPLIDVPSLDELITLTRLEIR